MPWQNNEDSDEPGRDGSGKSGKGGGKGDGKRRNPWGIVGGGRRDGRADGRSESSGTPQDPWGRGSDDGRRRESAPGGAPDFDEFIRRSQQRLRSIGGGGLGGHGGQNLPWGPIIGGIAVILVATLSAYQVGAGQQAVITRFGKYLKTTGPGFHLKLPSPIDTVTKVQTEDIRTTLIGSTGPDDENLMITGDGNVISIAYAVRWRIKNAEAYLFEVADPAATVRDATESAMREIISRTTMNNAIGPERASIADQVLERVQEILDSYHAGVLVQGVDINRADPPSAVDEAFKDVSAAQQDAEQFLNQARAYAQQVQAQAEGATAAFDKVYAEYRLAPEVTRKRMYLETMENVLGKVDTTVIEAPGVQAYLPLTEVQRQARPADKAPDTVTAEAPRKQ